MDSTLHLGAAKRFTLGRFSINNSGNMIGKLTKHNLDIKFK